MLWRIFGPEREEGKRRTEKFRCEKLHHFLSSPNTVRVNEIKDDKIGGTRSIYGEEEKYVQDFGG